jgi:hypothetical protein
MKKYYISDASPYYNHGCQNNAVWEDNGDGTATCVEATSCCSCWQVGHSGDYVYAEVGDIIPISEIPHLVEE